MIRLEAISLQETNTRSDIAGDDSDYPNESPLYKYLTSGMVVPGWLDD